MRRIPLIGLAMCVALFALTAVAGAQIGDPSFENSSSGNPPAAPWVTVAGNAVIETTQTALLPSHGDEYLRLDATGISGSGNTPGYGPHSTAVAQVKQTFNTPNHQSIGISIDWEFILTEGIGSSFNDFASIDIVTLGGGLVANVLFVDSGYLAGTPGYTNVPGAGAGTISWVPNQVSYGTGGSNPAPAGFKRAYLNLTGMLAPGTAYSLQITVANAIDSIGIPTLLVDNVRLLVGQQNQGNGSLRLLGSGHVDGAGSGTDWGGDQLQIGPYEFYTEPGARIAFRARSNTANTPWALFTGPIQYTGVYVAGVGTVNLNFSSSSFTTVLDGIAPGGGDDIIGTISYYTNILEGQIAPTTPVGTQVGYQALMLVPSAPNPIVLSAATEVVVGGTSINGPSFHPRMPSGATNLNLGDDDSGAIDFATAGFSGFSYYGTGYTQCFAGSNGYVTFGSGDLSLGEAGAAMLSGQPRISPLWDDLNPSTTSASGNGSVNYSASFQTLTISWNAVGEFGFVGARNNFAVQLYSNDSFTLYYGSTSPDDGLVGISPGGLPVPLNTEHSNVDWSGNSYYGGSRGTVNPGTARFERFAYADLAGLLRDKLDIATVRRIHFAPDGVGGYTFFTGLR